jgi:tetraacyldisaccharide 4'-kinase
MFETGILKTRTFDVPIISVGNITVGGSGKTPHVEYLIRLLMKDFNVAVLSRGYKRKSTGFILADANSTARDIGDEPYQMKRKFEQVTVAVDKNRCHGIDMLEECGVKPEVVLLDDAFQHRYVKPGINILLVDYHRLIIYDEMLPSGRLREPKEGKNRADIVIVTKCPKEMKPIDYRVITKAMDLYPYQQLYFSTINYGGLEPIFNGAPKRMEELVNENVLLLTGIASPQQMVHDLSPQCGHLQPLSFSDHHHFDAKDVQQINDTFATMEGPKCIVTTEKDATRLEGLEGLSDEVKASIYSLPITIQFLQEQQESFNNYITDYVRKNSRNSILVERKDDNKPQDSNYSGNRSRTISFRDN